MSRTQTRRQLPPGSTAARARISRVESVRLGMSALFIALGAVIVVQGLRLAAPWAYTATGLLMAGLGLYRLRLAWVLWTRSVEAASHAETDGHDGPTDHRRASRDGR